VAVFRVLKALSAVIFKNVLRSSAISLTSSVGFNYHFQAPAVSFGNGIQTDEEREKFLACWKEMVGTVLGISSD